MLATVALLAFKAWLIYFFLTSVAIITLMLVLGGALLRLVAPHLGPRLVQFACESWYFFPWVWQDVARSRLVVYGQAPPTSSKVLVVANHVAESDWSVVMWVACVAQRIGALKIFAKSELRYVPIIGQGMMAMGTVMLSRQWEEDKVKIERTFRHLNTVGVPYWLVSHPEGHRVTPARLLESQAFARSRGLTELQHTLVPRVKGFSATVLGLRSSLESVLDVTICWDKQPMSMPWCFLGGGGPRVIHVHLAEFRLADLPATHEGLQAWLHERWTVKDRLIASFKKNGFFQGERVVDVRVDRPTMMRRVYTWTAIVVAWTALWLWLLARFFASK